MPKYAIITGAGGALGGSVATAFADAGWQLALFAHSGEGRARLERNFPESMVLEVDLTRQDESRLAVRHVLSRFGGVDALLNIAGGFAMTPAEELEQQDFERQLDINLRTVVSSTQAVLPGMLEQGSGFVLGVAAAAALSGGSRMAPYAASKAALAAYLRSVQAELGPRGILTSILYPMGAIDTPGNRRSMPKADPAGWLDPDELASSILHLATRGPRGHIRELMVYPTPRT
ncbi:MAG TPA: SDR family NAD(P)-dependent oxidoreductase [Trueperaceae bacterium]